MKTVRVCLVGAENTYKVLLTYHVLLWQGRLSFLTNTFIPVCHKFVRYMYIYHEQESNQNRKNIMDILDISGLLNTKWAKF